MKFIKSVLFLCLSIFGIWDDKFSMAARSFFWYIMVVQVLEKKKMILQLQIP